VLDICEFNECLLLREGVHSPKLMGMYSNNKRGLQTSTRGEESTSIGPMCIDKNIL